MFTTCVGSHLWCWDICTSTTEEWHRQQKQYIWTHALTIQVCLSGGKSRVEELQNAQLSVCGLMPTVARKSSYISTSVLAPSPAVNFLRPDGPMTAGSSSHGLLRMSPEAEIPQSTTNEIKASRRSFENSQLARTSKHSARSTSLLGMGRERSRQKRLQASLTLFAAAAG